VASSRSIVGGLRSKLGQGGPLGVPPPTALRILAALRTSALFGRASAQLFHELLDHAELVTLRAEERLEANACFVAVLAGRVVVADAADPQQPRVIQTLHAGDTFGEAQLLRREYTPHLLIAQQRTELVVFREAGLHALPTHLRLELENSSRELDGARGLDTLVVDGRAELLGRSIERDFEEPVVVVTRDSGRWRVRYATETGALDAAAGGWQEAVAAVPHADYVILSLGRDDVHHGGPELGDEAQVALHVVISLPDERGVPVDHDDESVLSAVVLDPHASRRTTVRTLDLRPYGDARRRSCRLMLSPAALTAVGRAQGPAQMQALLREHQQTLSRWARFVTRRTVAVALGGGGAWGYFHVALLKLMEQHGVPVDLTSGTSFGALVSVYFAALGQDGLDLLTRRGRTLSRTQTLSLISTHPLEVQIGLDLEGADLTRLPIAANPFATNLTRVQGEAAWAGPAALGARASSSAPGLFGPTVLSGRGVFVDGVVAGNVPSAILISQGADLLVASNVVPRPPPKEVPSNRLVQLFSTVNPFDRVYEAYLSALFFLYAQGADHPGLGCIAVQGNDALESMAQRPLPSDFERSQDIVSHALSHPSLLQAADDIRAEWERRRKRRAR
jgi:hypothetical protein